MTAAQRQKRLKEITAELEKLGYQTDSTDDAIELWTSDKHGLNDSRVGAFTFSQDEMPFCCGIEAIGNLRCSIPNPGSFSKPIALAVEEWILASTDMRKGKSSIQMTFTCNNTASTKAFGQALVNSGWFKEISKIQNANTRNMLTTYWSVHDIVSPVTAKKKEAPTPKKNIRPDVERELERRTGTRRLVEPGVPTKRRRVIA